MVPLLCGHPREIRKIAAYEGWSLVRGRTYVYMGLLMGGGGIPKSCVELHVTVTVKIVVVTVDNRIICLMSLTIYIRGPRIVPLDLMCRHVKSEFFVVIVVGGGGGNGGGQGSHSCGSSTRRQNMAI